MKRFIILSTQRTGSTLFRLWLNSHDSIRCHGEVFYPEYRACDGLRSFCERRFSHAALFRLAASRPMEKLGFGFFPETILKRYIRALFKGEDVGAPWTDLEMWNLPARIGKARDKTAVGFKIMYDHLGLYPGLIDWIRDQRLHIIHLRRNNKLKIYVSRMRSRKTGVPHGQGKTRTIVPVRVDPLEFKRFHRSLRNEETRHNAMFSQNPMHQVTYEAYLRETDVARRKVCRFLGLSGGKMTWPGLARSGFGNLPGEIVNYDELRSHLKGTALFQYLANP